MCISTRRLNVSRISASKIVAKINGARILGNEIPLITQMARQHDRRDGEAWATAKRGYRCLENVHLTTEQIYEGLYQVGYQVVEHEALKYLVVAVDLVNFEKP